MKNFNYWKQSLEGLLQNEIVTDELVKKIIDISEMEYEYTYLESNKPSKTELNNLNTKIKNLENEILVYKTEFCKVLKVDSVEVIGDRVEFFKRFK